MNKQRHYEVSFSWIKPNKTYKDNLTRHILTTNIARSLQLLEKEFIDCEFVILSVQHKGVISMVDIEE